MCKSRPLDKKVIYLTDISKKEAVFQYLDPNIPVIDDSKNLKKNWKKRTFFQEIEPKSTLYLWDFISLGKNFMDAIECLEHLSAKDITLYILKYNLQLDSMFHHQAFISFVSLVKKIDSEFVSFNISQGIKRAKEKGRIKTSRNKKSILDGRRSELIKLLSQNLTLKRISETMNIHVNTLSNYLGSHSDLQELRKKN